MIPADIVLIDRHAHDPLVFERLGESRPARLQPIEQPGHGGDVAGQLDLLLGLADLGPEPGEIEDLHRLRLRSAYCARKPPSTGRVCPVTSAEARLAR